MPTITFSPSGKSITVPPGSSLLQACLDAGWNIPTPCARKGTCGKCRVRILSGTVPDDQRQDCLPEKLRGDGWRASCMALVNGDLVVADPDKATGDVVLSDFSLRGPVDRNRFRATERVMAPPSTADQTDDLARLLAHLGSGFADRPQPCLTSILRRLPAVMRQAEYRCRVVDMDGILLDVRPAGEGEEILGLAVDIGTTTIAAALCDAVSGDVLAVASGRNPQSKWGDDVISRIDCASRDGVLFEMRDSVVQAVARLAREAGDSAGISGQPVFATISANTTMNHIFLGVPPAGIAVSPFIPVFRDGMTVSGTEVGWPGPAAPLLYVLPNISAYVGGDITAGILAHDLGGVPGTTLLLDIGTNGEVALASRERIYSCSTAAGPAFEGARIEFGTTATNGAIHRARVNGGGDLEVEVIGGVPATGICGTGLLDAVAALRRLEVIDETGRILDDDELEELELSPAFLSRVHEGDNGMAVRLSDAGAAREVVLTQKDVREFQLAKGAIAAGVRVLLKAAGIGVGDLDRVLLAGGFGSYLSPASAIAAGLLPAGVRADAVHAVGNSSLAGARLCLLSPGERKKAEELAKRVEYIELSGRADFQEAFAEEMLFP